MFAVIALIEREQQDGVRRMCRHLATAKGWQMEGKATEAHWFETYLEAREWAAPIWDRHCCWVEDYGAAVVSRQQMAQLRMQQQTYRDPRKVSPEVAAKFEAMLLARANWRASSIIYTSKTREEDDRIEAGEADWHIMSAINADVGAVTRAARYAEEEHIEEQAAKAQFDRDRGAV
jgi:hypothetical protein